MDRAEGLRRLGKLYGELAQLERELGLVRTPIASPGATSSTPSGSYELVAEYGSDLISIHAASGEYLFVSPNCERLFGHLAGDLLGHNAYEFFHPDDIERVAEDHALHSADREGRVRYRLRCGDGAYRWVETRSAAHRAEAGVAQIVAITRDIHQETEAAARALQAEVELAKAQQLASIGRLAGAVGHELANPLAAALMGLETVMLDDQRFDLEMGNTLVEVRRSLGRAASVLSELNLLARETRDHASIDLDRCVEDVLEIAASRVSNRVDARLARTPLVTDPARCHQLVYNMLTAHLAGLPDGSQHARIHIDCRLVSGVPTLTMRSAVQLDRQMMVADLVSALRGEEGRYEVPLALARHVADALGARWSVESEDGLTRSTVEFPDQSAVPVRTS